MFSGVFSRGKKGPPENKAVSEVFEGKSVKTGVFLGLKIDPK